MWSVWYGDNTVDDIYDVVIGRPSKEDRYRRVRLVRHGCPDVKLCLVSPTTNYGGGWDVIVSGDKLTGERLVHQFHNIRAAVDYAILVRPDINAEWKKNR